MDSSGAQFTMLNSLRTGNVILDMGVAMAAPAAIRLVCDSDCAQKVKRYFFPRRPRFEPLGAVRTISCRTNRRPGFGQDQQDHVLMRAIKLYLQHLKVALPGRAQVQLTMVADAPPNRPMMAHASNDDPATNHRLTWLAAEKEWVDVGDGCSFRHFQHAEAAKEQGDRPDQWTVFELSSKAPDGAARVDAFITAALDWYREECGRMKDSRRWLYTMVAKRSRPNNDADDCPDFRYKRHQLTDTKTFANLFFPQKESLLRLLKDFEAKEGKYGISGFPHKCGLLLHGPPGTGKTSMIKALAQHTGRSVINVSLAQIETNAQLEAIMFDLNVDVVSSGDARGAKRLTFSDVIFVLEDVDACSHVVRRRDGHAHFRDADSPPGRIDRCLLLGHLRSEDAAQMLEHYFGGALSEQERETLDRLLRGDRSHRGLQMTPAEMEQLCAEHDSVTTLLGHFEMETPQTHPADGDGEMMEGARAAKRARLNAECSP